MNDELADSRLALHGVNEIGEESGNSEMVAGRDLPWLQDVRGVNVWSKWRVTFRDVVVLGPEGEHLFTFNLTEHDLDDAAEYADLKGQLEDALAPLP
jgi:hypothetical protein